MEARLRVPFIVRNASNAVIAVVAIAFSVQHMVPVLADQEPMVTRLMTHTWRDSAAARAPWLRQPLEVAMQSAAFEHDRLAFAADLMRTGKISQPRADKIAGFAVCEAYRRRVPSDLILGEKIHDIIVLRTQS